MSDYEFRLTSYRTLRFGAPAYHVVPALELALKELAHLEAYSPGWID